MNITFFIGNGFDLSLGLKTSYNDFLKYYLSIKDTDGNIKDLKNRIEKNISLWSDVELAFGRYTLEYNPLEIKIFEKCYNDFVSNLSIYLQKEERKIQLPIDEEESIPIFEILENIFNSFYSSNYLSQRSSELIKKLFDSDKGIINYNFINFNYTNCFDKFIELMQQFTPPIAHNNALGFAINDILNSPLHIHGKTGDGMIFGVDNETQISNESLSIDSMLKNYFIKSNAIDESETLANITAKQVINVSDIICIFGMSFGETDKTWWNAIYDWLLQNKKHQLILYIHEPNFNNCLVSLIAQNKSKIFNKLFNSDKLDIKNKIKDQIHFSFNKNLFGELKNFVKVSDEEDCKDLKQKTTVLI